MLNRLATDLCTDNLVGSVIGVDIAGGRNVATAGNRGLATNSDPMTRETKFDLASVTKVVGTALSLQRLHSAGQLNLDSPARSLIPLFPGTATIRELLQHRAGLWEWQPLYLAPKAAKKGKPSPFLALESIPLRYPTGSARHYSDLGFMYLGRIISQITSLPLSQAIDELITKPLELGITFGSVTSPVASSRIGDRIEEQMVASSVPYPSLWQKQNFNWRTRELAGEVADGNCFHHFAGISGHAGLFGTIDDLLDIGRALSADTEPELFDTASSDHFFTAGPDEEQALGWRRFEIRFGNDCTPVLWHPGFTGCALGFLPKKGISIAFLSNRLLSKKPQKTEQLWKKVLREINPMLTNHSDKTSKEAAK